LLGFPLNGRLFWGAQSGGQQVDELSERDLPGFVLNSTYVPLDASDAWALSVCVD